MSLALALLLAASAPDPEPACDPFDLTYIPVENPTRLFGLRPNLLDGLFGDAWRPVAAALPELVTSLGGCGEAGRLPDAADLVQVISEGPSLVIPGVGEKGAVAFGSDWLVLRTGDPFDWAGLVMAWFPGAVRVERAGHTYLTATVMLDIYGGEWVGRTAEVYFYPADSRSLLAAVTDGPGPALIDRLKAGGRVTPPALWAAVERFPVALAADFADRTWLTLPDGPARPGVEPYAELLRATGQMAVGAEVSAGGMRFWAVAAATDVDTLTDRFRAVAARVAGTARVKPAGSRVTTTVTVPLEALAGLGGSNR